MTTTLDPLAYYAANHCALFPIPAGKKDPTGIVQSFAKDWSREPEQWQTWRSDNPNCNFGHVAGPSNQIICDIDVAEVGREVAWTAWANWWTSRGLEVPQPQVQSARGGWHCLFEIPEGVDKAKLRQVPLIGAIKDVSKKAIVDSRIGNGFVVAAGSYYDGTADGKQSGPYVLLSDAAPYPAPAALLEAFGRRVRNDITVRPGFADPNHTEKVLKWMAERDCFNDYHRWVEAGMILRGEFGDEPGLYLWHLTNDGSVSVEQEEAKWQSFSSELTVDDVKIGTLRKRAKEAECPYDIGKTSAAMFKDVPPVNPVSASTVAKLAADSGAQLPLPEGTQSLMGNTHKIISDLGQPVLETFFETTKDAPLRPWSSNYPQLPSKCEELYPAIFEQMNNAIRQIIAMAESPKSFRQQRVLRVLAVLNQMHPEVYKGVVDRINGFGCAFTQSKIDQANKQFEVDLVYQVQGKNRTSFHADSKNKPDAAISDNVGIFLNLSGNRVRFDTFPKRAEVAQGDEPFVQFDQPELDRLWMLAKSADYNFHPTKDMFRSALKVEARKAQHDSLEDEVLRLSRLWDGVPRLDTWLTRTCNVADDDYHRAVGRNLIGGMVRRARSPFADCKQDETVIFISPEQGTGKSTLCKILALKEDWFLGSYKFGGSQQSSLPLLAGKWIVELGELAGLNKTDFEDVKTFLSETKDEYVAKYESEPTRNYRRCVFIGTSNIRQPLADPSGNRRFLPVHVVGEINLDWLKQNVEQLIAETAARDDKGETFGIPREIWGTTKEVQEAARTLSPVEEACSEWFDRREGYFYILSGDLRNAFHMTGLGAHVKPGVFMDKLGWRKAQVGPNRDRVWLNHPGNHINGCIQLVPKQENPNNRVEMRMVKTTMPMPACPVPPPVPSR